MKKIIALILSLALSFTCVLALASCGECAHADENGDKKCDLCSEPYAAEVTGLAKTLECYKNSLPTKVLTVSVQSIYDFNDDGEKEVVYDFTTTTTLVTGKAAGVNATKETTVAEVMNGIIADKNIPNYKNTVTSVLEYLQGKGRRSGDGVTMGEWVSGTNFAPRLGSIGIDITNENVYNAKYTENGSDGTLTFTIKKADVEAVFGKTIKDLSTDSDITVSITNDGAVITEITLEYSMKPYDNFPERGVKMTQTYTYDVEIINIA